jgi:glycosyltransferase involved in cell wall biosynthesis
VREKLKRIIFGLLGKDPEPVVVTFLSGNADLARRMEAEVRGLIPGLRHYTVDWTGDSAGELWLRLRREFRGKRIAMAPVLFTGEPEYDALRRAAFLFAPAKVLAYNARLERHHVKLSTWIASLLFLRGIPVDRIFLRPWGAGPQQPLRPASILAGRPASPQRPRIAILSPYSPYPLSHGGAVRIFNLLREASGEFDIFLFTFTEGQDTPEYQPLLDLCAKLILVPKPDYRKPRWCSLQPPEVAEYRVPAMREALRRVMREENIALLQVEYTALASYGGDVLVEHDVTFDLFQQIQRREPTLSSSWNLWRWKHFEIPAVRKATRAVVMSAKDAEMLDEPNVRVIQNGVDLDRFQPEPERANCNLLFIGSFRHFPNIEAYRYFTERIWPVLRERHPDMTVTIVAGPDPMLHWSAHTGTLAPPPDDRIRLLGFVADVRPLYVEANLVLVPTTVSAGTNLKVLEAMAMERAVVSTTSGCAGLGLEHGRSVWIADSAEDFALGVTRLMEDPAMRAAIARAGRIRAYEEFGWKAIGERQAALWRELLDG